MEPRAYVSAYLERAYLAAHPELTAAARELVHEDVPQRLEKYATDAHAQALVAYTDAHERLMRELDAIEDIPEDEEFERKRAQLFDEARLALFKIAETDRLCVDAELVGLLLSDISIDACLSELMKLERRVHDQLISNVAGFSDDAPHFFDAERAAAHAPGGAGTATLTAAAWTASEPTMIGWLHTLEALAQLCLASARYRAAERYARLVLRAEGYPSHAEGTVFLALARLEDEDGFFAFAHELEAERGEQAAAALDDSPWFLLGRTLLLYKLGRRKPARRALRDFAARCEGGAFFLLNPTYMAPYLPVRPQPRKRWDLAHEAVWEADGIIVDTPDFVPWAESVEGVYDASEHFANRNGF
ncbi:MULTISPECIES: hypothetical protein [Enorma]|uniref:hypothetical protein n=1 Tax=Enorma TaxID=1472762 RepID=UPI000347C0DC|nr:MULTISPECIES: hypothetical protein [Enorma]